MSESKGPSEDYKVHGSKGVYCGGEWIDIEDCGDWVTGGCPGKSPAVHAKQMREKKTKKDGTFDVIIIGAGCVGSAIARELAKLNVSVLMLERDDDVTQGATKGNSGIVHSGYDDKPGSVRAKYCWKGNQMFADLDKDLKFGFLKNGSLVLASGEKEEAVLEELMERGRKNGVQHLRIVKKDEVHAMEPYLNKNVTAALFSPSAGTVTPYEFAIALAENAADNGVDVRIRHEVTSIKREGDLYVVSAHNWDPDQGTTGGDVLLTLAGVAVALFAVGAGILMNGLQNKFPLQHPQCIAGIILSAASLLAVPALLFARKSRGPSTAAVKEGAVHPTLAFQRGSNGESVTFKSRFVVNCAGLFSDKIANMVGDESFTIKPRLGDYLLLHKNQGHLASRTLFPCPDPVLGKGVLVQTTLWGNLILGPTARDTYLKDAMEMDKKEVFDYILTKCRELVPAFDAGEVIHSFCGARAKSSRGDWIIEESKASKNFFHVAGIDSPGLAGSPAIAVDVVQMLCDAGLSTEKFAQFNPKRRPLIVPKNNWKTMTGERLKVYKPENMGVVPPDQNVLCKCEKVTEAEIVHAIHSSLTVDNTQAIRRRTRAGMGHCQAGEFPHCEQRVAEIIAREKKIKVDSVGRRPWPATSLLPQRWLSEEQRAWFRSLVSPPA